MGEENDDDRIGYGRPPKAHQFKKGQSGNPAGRPKGARNLKTIIDDVLGEPVRLRRDGGVATVTMSEAIFRSMAAKAAKGDVSAFKALLPFFHSGRETDASIDSPPLSHEELAILNEHLASLKNRRS